MAKGSQQFTWKIAPQIPRRCKWCDRPLRIRDVAEVRYSPEPWFKCTACRTAELTRLAQLTRRFLAESAAIRLSIGRLTDAGGSRPISRAAEPKPTADASQQTSRTTKAIRER